jgi:hypothetical protein
MVNTCYHGGARGGQSGKKGSSSFLKKRTKKLLRVWAEPIRRGRSQNEQKFFASFFQKRRACLLLPLQFCGITRRHGERHVRLRVQAL